MIVSKKLLLYLACCMSDQHPCPSCQSEITYPDVNLWVCTECFHEWNPSEATTESEGEEVLDANGNVLQDGDSVTVVKDLKVKGSSDIKAGTKVKNIRLTDGHDGHNISCKIDGVGSMYLKSEFVRKA